MKNDLDMLFSMIGVWLGASLILYYLLGVLATGLIAVMFMMIICTAVIHDTMVRCLKRR